MLETSLEFAVVPVCALNSSSASSAARPLAGWDGGTHWDEIVDCGKGDFAGIGRTGTESGSSTVMPQGLRWRAGWLVGCAKDCFCKLKERKPEKEG